jgi:hypothetical protein
MPSKTKGKIINNNYQNIVNIIQPSDLENKIMTEVKNVELNECVSSLMGNISEEIRELETQEEELMRFRMLLEGTIKEDVKEETINRNINFMKIPIKRNNISNNKIVKK